jgi:predicted MFS family arabinose efflux permease
MSSPIEPGKQKTSPQAYFAFCLLFLMYMFDYIDRLVIVSLFPFLKAEWGMSDTQCGLLVSAVYWSIIIFSFPVSILIDRWSRKKSMALMGFFWSLATLACAFTTNFRQLFVARTAIGVGEAGYAPGGAAMISALFPQESRAKVVGFWNASIPLGSALGIAIGGAVAEHFGWRHAFGLVALPGMLLSLLFLTLKDYKTVELQKTVTNGVNTLKARMSRMDLARQFIGNRTLIFNNLAFAGNVFVTTALLTWLPTYFHRTEGLGMTAAGMKGGSVMLLAIIGAPLGGYLADKWLKRRINARLLFPCLSSLLTSVLLFITFMFLEGSAQYFMLLGVGLSAVAFVPAAVAVTQDVVHPGLRAISLSINVIVQHLLGSALGPTFVGMVSDAYSLKTGLLCLPIFTALGGVLFFFGSFYYERDLARVEKVEIEFE